MPPILAAVVCLLFVGYLFWADIAKRDGHSISWAPLAWMFLAGSRWASSWLDLRSPMYSVDAYAEGSPVDRAVFFSLILWGAIVLSRRTINWGTLLSENKWITLYLLFCLSSILWSDEPFILVRRWIKDLGNPIMALVILTEQRPYEAVGITIRRLSFLLLPLSVLFVRYYPELGRSYRVDGSAMFTGVGHQKNDLGLMCLIAGMYFFWKLLQKRTGKEAAETIDRYDLVLIGMLLYLLRMSDSQTSVVCLVASVGVLTLSRMKFLSKKPRQIITVLAIGAFSAFVLESTFQVKALVLSLLGRDPTLTGRTDLWEVIMRQEANPIVGAGFMSFWAGPRMAAIWKALGTGINQAHSGYLEQYLNLGYFGLAFIGGIMVSALLNVRKQLGIDPSAAILRLCFIVAAALYNYTEASFYGINNMWVLLLVGCIDVSGCCEQRQVAALSPAAPAVDRTWKAAAVSSPAYSRRFDVPVRRQGSRVVEPRRR